MKDCPANLLILRSGRTSVKDKKKCFIEVQYLVALKGFADSFQKDEDGFRLFLSFFGPMKFGGGQRY